MKKIIGFIFAIAGLVFVISACSGDTYAKRLEEEEKRIKQFRIDSGLTFITKYPADGVFKEKEYFYYSSGDTAVYFRVIHPGNLDDKAIPNEIGVSSGTEVTFRFRDTYEITGSTPVVLNNEVVAQPVRFRYGEVMSYGSDTEFMSYAITIPLRYVGNGAEVSFIIPFRSGSSFQSQYYMTFYYGSLTYKFID